MDVLIANGDGHGRTLDPALLDHATALDRILLTHGKDFLIEGARRQTEEIFFVGIVYAPQENMTIGDLVESLLLIATRPTKRIGSPERCTCSSRVGCLAGVQ